MMGAVREAGNGGDRHANPSGTDGMVFVEFGAIEGSEIASLFKRLGFRAVARHATKAAELWAQGSIRFIINSQPGSHAHEFAKLHGPCISALAFRVANSAEAHDRAIKAGAADYEGSQEKLVEAPVVRGIGGSLLYLLDHEDERIFSTRTFPGLAASPDVPGVGLVHIDHLTHNVLVGNVDHWSDFYREAFGFREIWYYHAKGKVTGLRTKALKSPCNKICIPVNEATEPESQIQEWIDLYRGEGVQHIALLSSHLCRSIESLAEHSVPFMSIPESYYSGIDERLPGHGEDVARLQRNGILLDGERAADGEWELLLQIFSKNLIGPIFFEFIQRKGNEGFGEGNAKALFEAIEREQIERGVVTT